MDIKALAKRYEVAEGELKGVVLWMVPYRRLAWDNAIRGLEAIEPQWLYTNTVTGETTYEEPPQLKTAKELALKKKKVPEIPWTQTRLWQTEHDTFCAPLSCLVGLDLPDDASVEAQVFDQFWREPFPDIASKWRAFNELVGTSTSNALWTAFRATRENPAPAPAELTPEEATDERPLAEMSDDDATPSSPSTESL